MAHHPRLSPAVWRGDSYDGFILGFICGSIVFAVSIGGISFLVDAASGAKQANIAIVEINKKLDKMEEAQASRAEPLSAL